MAHVCTCTYNTVNTYKPVAPPYTSQRHPLYKNVQFTIQSSYVLLLNL